MIITHTDMLAQALRAQRRKQRLSQGEAARRVGVRQSTVSSFENHPCGTKLETLFKLLAALNLELHLIKPEGESA